MSDIRVIPAADLDRFVTIAANAYPGMKVNTAEERQQFATRLQQFEKDEPGVTLYGAYREGDLVGGMRLFDFDVRFLSCVVPAGGVGLVAVDLLHKKEHIAKDLISSFVRHYRERNMPLAMLYPFRPDFYKQMGFGYGTRQNQYRIAPASFPRGRSKAHVQYLGQDDVPQLVACYNRAFERTHGLIRRTTGSFTRLLNNAEHRVIGVRNGDQIDAYLVGAFKPARPDNWLINDLHVSELVYNTPDALHELLTFLHTQADQINQIVLISQDDNLHFLLRDPRNGSGNVVALHHETSVQGVGLMYRVLDVPSMFRALQPHNFNNQTCTVQFVIEDTFLPENNGSTTVRFVDGRAEVIESDAYDVALRLDVANFSSLLAGAISLKQLLTYGLIELADLSYLEPLNTLFRADRPICMTLF